MAIKCCGNEIHPELCGWCGKLMSPIKIRDLLVVQEWIKEYGKYRFKTFKSGNLKVCNHCIQRLNTIILRCGECPHQLLGIPHSDTCVHRVECRGAVKSGC